MNNPQLPLGLALRDSARFESYFAGTNREVVDNLKATASGNGEVFIYVAGADGMGKTHLLQATCHAAAQNQRSTAYFSMSGHSSLAPAVYAGLEQQQLVCLDDIDAIAGNAEWERALFDLFNRMRDSGNTLLVGANRRADQVGFRLPDLVSRLGWGVTYVLRPLADDDVLQALACRAETRGLELPADTAAFLLKRIPRDLPSVFDLLDRLDEASMVEQRRLTIPFVKSVLEDSAGG